MSGSEDMNIRVWKDEPSRKIGPMGIREKRKTLYRKKLMEKFKFNQEIKRLKRGHMPKYVYNARVKKHIMSKSSYRKKENVEFNNPNDLGWWRAEKKKRLVKSID